MEELADVYHAYTLDERTRETVEQLVKEAVREEISKELLG